MNKKMIAPVIVAGVIGAVIGSSIPSEKEKNYDQLLKDKAILVGQVDDLQKKVEDAKPYFEMKQSEKLALEEKASKEKAEKTDKLLEENSKTLSSGHFMVGVDFQAGTYDIIAVSGNGNVYSNNEKNPINAIMGVREDDMYQKTFKNVYLPFGTTLTVDGVTVKIIPTQLNSLDK